MLNPLEEQTKRAAVYGLPPEPPVTTPPNVNLPPAKEGVWSALSLYDFAPPPKWYEMPGGGGIWVHPLSDEEINWMNLQAAREVRALRLPEDQEAERAVLQQARARVWQVILSARQGEEPGAAQVLRPEDAPALRRNPGWWQAVRNICRLSDSLGADEAVLLETMRDFFEAQAAALLSLSSSLSSEGGATGCRKVLQDFSSLVSSIKQRGRLTQQDLSTLRALSLTAERIPTSTASSDPGLPGENNHVAEPAGVG